MSELPIILKQLTDRSNYVVTRFLHTSVYGSSSRDGVVATKTYDDGNTVEVYYNCSDVHIPSINMEPQEIQLSKGQKIMISCPNGNHYLLWYEFWRPRVNDFLMPTVIVYNKDKDVVSKHWLKDIDNYVQENDLPSKISYYSNGINIKTWLKDLEFYREEKPTMIAEYSTGHVAHYWLQGDYQENIFIFARSDDKPTIVEYCPNEIVIERWMNSSGYYRPNNKPTEVITYRNKVEELWLVDEGKYFRENDEPTVVVTDNDGTVLHCWWVETNKAYRPNDEPSVIEYCADGTVRKMWVVGSNRYRANGGPTCVITLPDGEILSETEDPFAEDSDDSTESLSSCNDNSSESSTDLSFSGHTA